MLGFIWNQRIQKGRHAPRKNSNMKEVRFKEDNLEFFKLVDPVSGKMSYKPKAVPELVHAAHISFSNHHIPQTDLSVGVLTVLYKGPWIVRSCVHGRVDANVSVFTSLCDTCSRLVETKWSVASVFVVKHYGFETFLFQEDLELPWPPQPRRCFLEASQMTPRCPPGLR